MELPYLNKQYTSLPLEEWRVIPFTNDLVEVSNLGRVKTLDRYVLTKNGRTVFYKGKILCQPILKYKNNYTNDFALELVCSYRVNGKQYRFSVRRMVYNLFIRNINFNDDHLVVMHKDGNYLNTASSNLYVSNIGIKQKKIYQLKRAKLLHTYITPETKEKGCINRFKEVTQYTFLGKKVAHFSSIKQATEKTKICGSAIVAAAKAKKSVSAGGFLWQYGNGSQILDVSYYFKFIENSKRKSISPVTQFNLSGEKIKSFTSIKQAAFETKISPDAISLCVNKKTKISGGFLWLRGIHSNNLTINESNNIQINKSSQNLKQPLLKISPLTKNIISIYTSISEASEIEQISRSSIRRASNHKKSLCKGFYWSYLKVV